MNCVVGAVSRISPADADLSRVEMRTVDGKISVLLQTSTPRKLFGRDYETVKAIRIAIAEALGIHPDTVTLEVMDDGHA
jgi:ribosomal protein S3